MKPEPTFPSPVCQFFNLFCLYNLGQFCNEKVEEQKKNIYKKYASKSAKEKIYLLAVSECLLEEVVQYATNEYIATMGMQHYAELFTPVCRNMTSLP